MERPAAASRFGAKTGREAATAATMQLLWNSLILLLV